MQFTLKDPTHTPLFSLGEKPPPRMHGHMEIFLPHRTNVHQIYGRDFFLSGICCHYVHLNSSKAILMCVHSKPRTLIFLKNFFFIWFIGWGLFSKLVPSTLARHKMLNVSLSSFLCKALRTPNGKKPPVNIKQFKIAVLENSKGQRQSTHRNAFFIYIYNYCKRKAAHFIYSGWTLKC